MNRVRTTTDGVSFRCPGCGDVHSIPTSGPRKWTWSGSRERPTIQPSLDVRSGHYAPHWKIGDECWCGRDYAFTCYRCHSIVTDGRIYFCPDSTHAHAGQTIDLTEIN